MPRKIASLVVAVAILAAAFVLVPDPDPGSGSSAPLARATSGNATAPADALEPTPKGPDPASPKEEQPTKNGGSEVIDACARVTDRLATLGGVDFRQQVGDALHAKSTPEEVMAICQEMATLDDAGLLADVKARTDIEP